MNTVSTRFASVLKNIFFDEKDDIEVFANGSITDKKDVEDPTGKFSGPRHIGTIYKSKSNRRNVTFHKPEYDLPMVANAVQLDGILRRAINLYTEHILKNDFELTSKNLKIQRHVNRRMKEIQNLTGISFYETLNWISTQLVTYGNAYVVKQRDRKKSALGKRFKSYGKVSDPIVGLFLVDASTIEIGLNNQGNVTSYKQRIRGEEREWDERDVIHFNYNKIPGTLTGMSPILPVLDDVRALRKLEEEIEILGFQYSIPLYLYKVGNKDVPPAPGEVEEVSNVVNNMPAYGMLVVPGHHSIEVPSNANDTIDIIKYVNHFKQRIYGGLGVSPVAMGEVSTSNRNTAEVLDGAMQTITKTYQSIIKNRLEIDLFKEIMLDGGFKSLDDELEFNFPEIDLENQIKKETHIVQLWQNNLISRTEARNLMDYEANIQENDTFLEKVDIVKIKAETQSSIAIEKSKPKPTATGTSSSTKKSGSSSAKKAKTTGAKVRPANQHGKSSGRPKYVKNSLEVNLLDDVNIFNLKDFILDIDKKVTSSILQELDYTINNICSFYHLAKPDVTDNPLVDKYVSGLSLILEDKIVRATKKMDDDTKLAKFGQNINEFLTDQLPKIDNLAKILIYKSLGYKTILVTSGSCPKHADTNLEITNIDYSTLPPFEYQCNCTVDEENFNEHC